MGTKIFKKTATLLAVSACLATLGTTAAAQETKVVIGMSGWTGFAPLTLAEKTGLFKKQGAGRGNQDDSPEGPPPGPGVQSHPVRRHHRGNPRGLEHQRRAHLQIVQLDKSYGADGLAVRGDIKGFADLKGKTIGVDAPGTAPYFGLAWMLSKNNMSLKDVKTTTLSPQAAAQAFVAGQNDAAMTYEPYLSTVRDNPASGKILATTLDYPMVMDTLGCAPDWLKANPKAAQGLVNAYFDALAMIKADPAKSNEIMGAAVKQSGEAFAKSSSFLRWQDKAANQKFFAGELQAFMRDASKILLEAGVIRQLPTDFSAMYDASFVK